MKTMKHITAPPRHRAPSPKPATTPAMVQAFWHRLFTERASQARLDWLQGFGNIAYADPYAAPFVVRLYGDDPAYRQVAYLSVVDGRAQWRLGTKDMGYGHSPVVDDPDVTVWLDSLFWWYTATETQKRSTGRPTNIQSLVAERIRNMKKKQGTWKRNRSY